MSERIDTYTVASFLLILVQAVFGVLFIVSNHPRAYEAILVMVSFFALLVVVVLAIELFCFYMARAEKRQDFKNSEEMKAMQARSDELYKENTRLANEAQQGMSSM